MRNLADAALDFLWFLEFSEEEELDPDNAVKMLESLSLSIQEIWTDEERNALSEAAARRLADFQTPDEHGNLPRGMLTDDQRALLEALSKGRFDGYLDYEDKD